MNALYPLPRAENAAPVLHTSVTRAPERDRLSVVTSRAGFDALEPEWNDLFRRAGRGTHVFQTFNWNWHWANHYLGAGGPPGLSPAIVTVHREDRLVLLWPLVMARGGGLSVLRWMGEPVSQYGDALVEDLPDKAALLRQSWGFIKSHLGADAIHLRKVREDAEVASLLREAEVARVASEQAPYLDLASAPSFAEYEKRYSGKARKNRRRLMRRLEERGPIAMVRHTSGADAGAAARAAIALKARWTRSSGRIGSALADERFAAFFADVAEARCRPAGCAVTAMTSNGEIAGMAIDVTCGGHRVAHIIVHDPALSRFSAGTLLLQEWIRTASADGIATFDLLAPAYAYKADWADGAADVHDFAAAFTLKGHAYARIFVGLVRPALKAGLEVLPTIVGKLRVLLGRGRAQDEQERAG